VPGPPDDEGAAPEPAPDWVAPGSAPASGPVAPRSPDPGAPPPGYGPPPPGYGQPPLGSGPPPPGYGGPAAAGWAPGWGPPPALPKGGSFRTGPLPLHPMTVGDILDGAFKLMKANAAAIVTIVAVFVVPIQLLAAFAQRNLFDGAGFLMVFDDPSLAEAGSTGADTVLQVLASLANLVVLPFLAGAISQVVAASYLGQELRAGPALRATLRRFWALTGAWVIKSLLQVAGFVVAGVLAVVLVVGGAGVVAALVAVAVSLLVGAPILFVVMGLSVMTAPAIVVEELGPIQGLRRSWRLASRRFWPVLGIALLAGLIASVIGQVLSVVPSLAALLVGLRWGWLLLGAGGVLTSIVTLPIVAVVATLLYFDARIRTEGFDLQVIGAELAHGAGGVGR
jgi:hypothetical protein